VSSTTWQGFLRRTSQGLWPHGVAALPWLLLSLFAFRGLAGFDPGRPLAHEASPLFVPADTAPGFVFGLIAFILYMRHRQIARALRQARPSPAGLLLVLPATALFAWAQHTGARDLELLGLVPWMLGAALLLAGRPLARLVLLPTLLLLFAFPMPAVLTNQIVYGFQVGTAHLATAVLNAIGVTALLEGDMIYTRGYVFEVIETCSGLRIVETLLLSAFAYGQILCNVRRHQVVLVLLAPIIGFLLNGARVLMIVFTPRSYAAEDHTLQGLVVIVLGVFALAGVDSLLHRWWPGPAAAPALRRPGPEAGANAVGSPWPWTATALAAALVAFTFAIPEWQWTAGRPPWNVALSTEVDGWQAKRIEDDKTFLGSVAYVRSLHRRYARDGAEVDVFVAMDDRLERDRSMLSPKHRVPGAGWQVAEVRRIDLPWAPEPVLEVRAHSRGREVLAWQWYEGRDGLGRETFRQVAALDNSVLRAGGDVFVYRVSTPLEPGPEGRARAETLLREFAERLPTAITR
jgi:EpsI family protein